MKFVSLLVADLFLSANANAQLRKCTGADGKVTYSDTLCSATAVNETGIRVNQHTMQGAAGRQDGQDMKTNETKMKTNEAVGQAIASGSGDCKFSYYEIGDDMGKTLAEAAKKECIANLEAKVRGQTESKSAYERWKDHRLINKRTVCSGTALAIGNGLASVNSVCR